MPVRAPRLTVWLSWLRNWDLCARLGLALELPLMSHFLVSGSSANGFQMRMASRPKNLAFIDCENVTVQHVRIADSSDWTQLFRRCTNVLEDHVFVEGSTVRACWERVVRCLYSTRWHHTAVWRRLCVPNVSSC
jgi:hypothetical protein